MGGAGNCTQVSLWDHQALYSLPTGFLKPHPEPDLKTYLGPTSNTSTKTGTSVPRNLQSRNYQSDFSVSIIFNKHFFLSCQNLIPFQTQIWWHKQYKNTLFGHGDYLMLGYQIELYIESIPKPFKSCLNWHLKWAKFTKFPIV